MTEKTTIAERANDLEQKLKAFAAAPTYTRTITAMPMVSLAADLVVDMAREMERLTATKEAAQ
tara:strand:- start:3662 stop:3850 length:189 start_codon:yes stop_codon:yes gene_type:complete